MAKGPRRLWGLNRDGQGAVTGRNLGAPVAPADAARLEDLPQPSLAIPTMDGGGGSAGDTSDLTYAKGTHQHPEVPPIPPAVVASTLYPAKVVDANLRKNCRGLLPHGSGVGFNTIWSPSPGTLYTWQMNGYVIGGITFYSHLLINKTGGADIMAVAGDRLVARSDTYTSGEAQYYGIYVVVFPGDLTHPAIIQRAPDANTPATLCHGMTVQIDGPSNAEHNGDYFTLTTSDPIVVDTTALTFSVASSYTSTDSYELLTGPQLTSEGASNEPLVESWIATSGTGDTGATDFFTTIAGTPGLSSLPAGMWTANLPEVYVDDDSTGTTVVKVRITQDNGGVWTTLFDIVSPPLSMSAVPMAPQYNQAADIAFSPTYKLVVQVMLSTTSPTPVRVFFRYSDPSHATWIQCPLALAMAGITPSGSIVVPLVDTYPTLSTTPVVPPAAQTVGDFDTLAVGTIPVELNGWAMADVGQTGTIAVMVGGTKDNPDGTIAATMTYTGTGSYTQILLQASITNPGGKLPVKLVLASSDAAHVLFVQGVSLVIGTGSAGASSGGGSAAWDGITGTLSAQTDLASALAGKLATTDPSVTNARAPTAHASTHASAGSDPVTIAESQVTNLTTDLAAKEPGLGNPSVTGYVLSSTTGGARSWVAQTGGGGGSTPLWKLWTWS